MRIQAAKPDNPFAVIYEHAVPFRSPATATWMRPEQLADGGIINISLNVGTIGPTKSYGMVTTGGGGVEVSLNDVRFIDSAYRPKSFASCIFGRVAAAR